jgi:hypothetical protein
MATPEAALEYVKKTVAELLNKVTTVEGALNLREVGRTAEDVVEYAKVCSLLPLLRGLEEIGFHVGGWYAAEKPHFEDYSKLEDAFLELKRAITSTLREKCGCRWGS